jgi:hypothetical protein
MPTQNTTIDEGFEGCGSVRISYSTTATPNTPLLEDDAGRYLLVDRPEPTQALKIVLQHTDASDPYDSYTATYRVTGTSTIWNGDALVPGDPYDETFNTGSYGRGPYHHRTTRTINQDYPDGGYSYSTRMRFYSPTLYEYEYDESGNQVEYVIERLGFEIQTSSQNRVLYATQSGSPIFISSNSTAQILSLTTSDGRAINIETAAVSDGWAIVVYEVYEWGDSELSRFQFDSDPSPITVECLESVCDDDCIPTYDSTGNLLCICRDAEVNETDGYEYQPYEHNQTRPRYNEYTP